MKVLVTKIKVLVKEVVTGERGEGALVMEALMKKMRGERKGSGKNYGGNERIGW